MTCWRWPCAPEVRQRGRTGRALRRGRQCLLRRASLPRASITTWRSGATRQGAARSGVLEQSWRVGGATGPEIAALEVFRARARTPAGARDRLRDLRRRCRAAGRRDRLLQRHRSARRPPDQVHRGATRMPTRANTIDIPVDGKHIAGTLVGPDTMVPGVLLVHGWDGSQAQYIARAHEIATLGCICLTFDLRGHVRHQEQRETRHPRGQPARRARRLRRAGEPSRGRSRGRSRSSAAATAATWPRS